MKKTSRNTTYENLWEITKAVQKRMFISRRLKVMLMLHMKLKKKQIVVSNPEIPPHTSQNG